MARRPVSAPARRLPGRPRRQQRTKPRLAPFRTPSSVARLKPARCRCFPSTSTLAPAAAVVKRLRPHPPRGQRRAVGGSDRRVPPPPERGAATHLARFAIGSGITAKGGRQAGGDGGRFGAPGVRRRRPGSEAVFGGEAASARSGGAHWAPLGPDERGSSSRAEARAMRLISTSRRRDIGAGSMAWSLTRSPSRGRGDSDAPPAAGLKSDEPGRLAMLHSGLDDCCLVP
jgi:hypothetical protein